MSGDAKEVIVFGLAIDKDFALLVLGAIIGFGASLVTNCINNRTQRNKEEKEKAINIIADAVKFVTKAHELAGDLIFKMRHFNSRIFRAPSLDANKAAEEQAAYLLKASEKATIFFEELKFNSFQLKRLVIKIY